MSRLQCSFLACLAFSLSSAAHALPDTITYAATVTDDEGPVNATLVAAFAIYDAPEDGVLLWRETDDAEPVIDGALVHSLGSLVPLDDALAAAPGHTRYLQVTLDGDILSPRTPLTSVPYALRTREAETLQGLAPDDLVTRDDFAALLPADLADGDQDTLYSAGAGLALHDATFSIPDRTLIGAQLAGHTITDAELAHASVGADQLQSEAVRADHIAPGAVTTLALRGTEVLVYTEASGCGGGLRPFTTCSTQPCAVKDGALKFRTCSGSCNVNGTLHVSYEDAPSTCANLVLTGSLISTEAAE
jgi:hypothetical protein